MSFGAGVILNEELGAVKFRGNEYPQPWVLKYGYGRTLAQIELGIKGWAFNPIEGTDTEIEDVQSFENEPNDCHPFQYQRTLPVEDHTNTT